MKTLVCLCVFVFGIVCIVLADDRAMHSYVPPAGLVPDAQTAIRIAEAVWLPIYGKETIQNEKPFIAILQDDVWKVTGSIPKGLHGGVALAEISRRDGCIIRVSHGK